MALYTGLTFDAKENELMAKTCEELSNTACYCEKYAISTHRVRIKKQPSQY